MSTFLERLTEESRELRTRVSALTKFIDAKRPDTIAPHHWILLRAQLAAMLAYSTILQARIDDLNKDNA